MAAAAPSHGGASLPPPSPTPASEVPAVVDELDALELGNAAPFAVDVECADVTMNDKASDKESEASAHVVRAQSRASMRVLEGSIAKSLLVRLPWLLVALLGGLAASLVIERFEDVLSSVVAVGFFVPVVMDMGGNMGSQAAAILVRGMAQGVVSNATFLRHLRRELLFALTVGLVTGSMAFFFIWVWQGAIRHEDFAIPLAGAVAITLLCVCMLGSACGFLFPFVSYKMHLDAAAVSTPLITTVKDIVALLLYFGVASLLLGSYLHSDDESGGDR